MSKYILVHKKSLEDVVKCFADQDELDQFCNEMAIMIEDIVFSAQLAARSESEDYENFLALKQLFVFGMFLQKNVEVVQSLIKAVQFKEVSEEEISELNINKEDEFFL